MSADDTIKRAIENLNFIIDAGQLPRAQMWIALEMRERRFVPQGLTFGQDLRCEQLAFEGAKLLRVPRSTCLRHARELFEQSHLQIIAEVLADLRREIETSEWRVAELRARA